MPEEITLKPVNQPNQTVPQAPITPPADILAQTFTLDPSLISNDPSETKIVGANDGVIEVPNKPASEVVAAPKVPVVAPPVEKKDDKVVAPADDKKSDDLLGGVLKAPKGNKTTPPPVTQGKEVIKPILPPEKKDDAFDYTGFTPQEVTNLKNMSRQSREWTAAVVKENRQLAGLKDSTYLQHELGYTLSPDYQQIQTAAHYGNVEASVWQQQLELIAAGKEFRDIVGWNPDGSPKMSEPMQPTHAHEERVRMNAYNCVQALNQMRGQLQTFPQQFKQRMSSDIQAIDNEQKARFAWHNDPKLLDYEVNIEGVGDKSIKDVKQTFKQLWPPYLANSKAVDVAADLFVTMQIQAAQLREAQNGQQIATIKQQEVARGEPSSEAKPVATAGQAVNGITEFSLAGMPS